MSEARCFSLVVWGFSFQNIGLNSRKWVKFWSFHKICDGLTGFCDGLTGLILLHKRQMRFCTREMWRINGDDGLTGDGLTGFHCICLIYAKFNYQNLDQLFLREFNWHYISLFWLNSIFKHNPNISQTIRILN